MGNRHGVLFLCGIVSAFGLIPTLPKTVIAQSSVPTCPISALSGFGRHKIVPGETLESIALRYNLHSASIVAMNPALQNGRITVGSEIQIPPDNGIVVQVLSGQDPKEYLQP